MALTLGIDDAGRGPVLGPMILAGVLLDPEQEKLLRDKEVKDSKAVLHPTRIKLAELIKQNSHAHKIVKSYPEDIDYALTHGTNLNTLEAKKAAEIINAINKGEFLKQPIKVIIDCPSVNTASWKSTLMKFITTSTNLTVYCEHKADVNHVSASAASILAKVTREDEVTIIKEKVKQYGDPGSGYPSDPYTKEFLSKHGAELANSGIFRKTWATWKTLFPSKDEKQGTLF